MSTPARQRAWSIRSNRKHKPVPDGHWLKGVTTAVTAAERNVAPVSWWLGLSRSELDAAIVRERHRMRWSRVGSLSDVSPSGVFLDD